MIIATCLRSFRFDLLYVNLPCSFLRLVPLLAPVLPGRVFAVATPAVSSDAVAVRSKSGSVFSVLLVGSDEAPATANGVFPGPR